MGVSPATPCDVLDPHPHIQVAVVTPATAATDRGSFPGRVVLLDHLGPAADLVVIAFVPGRGGDKAGGYTVGRQGRCTFRWWDS